MQPDRVTRKQGLVHLRNGSQKLVLISCRFAGIYVSISDWLDFLCALWLDIYLCNRSCNAKNKFNLLFSTIFPGFSLNSLLVCLVSKEFRGSSVIMVISPLRSIMEDQVCHLNDIGVPADFLQYRSIVITGQKFSWSFDGQWFFALT